MDEYPRSLSWLLYVVCKFVVDRRTEDVLEILVVGLLRDSNNNNNIINNNNNHNIIRMNRDDETLVKSGKFKDCVLSWKFEKKFASSVHVFFGIRVSSWFFLRPRSCL